MVQRGTGNRRIDLDSQRGTWLMGTPQRSWNLLPPRCRQRAAAVALCAAVALRAAEEESLEIWVKKTQQAVINGRDILTGVTVQVWYFERLKHTGVIFYPVEIRTCMVRTNFSDKCGILTAFKLMRVQDDRLFTSESFTWPKIPEILPGPITT